MEYRCDFSLFSSAEILKAFHSSEKLSLLNKTPSDFYKNWLADLVCHQAYDVSAQLN